MYILNNIIPHWYGTKWDFDGYTSVPNKGEIACGYFVSTTLRDMGLNLNRYKLAQQAPINEANSIAIDTNYLNIYEEKQITDVLKSLRSGLYFIGLDNHVGFLYVNKPYSYFIHSNYIEGSVMIEETKNSEAFYSSIYYISDITYNKKLMKYWLENNEILVHNK